MVSLTGVFGGPTYYGSDTSGGSEVIGGEFDANSYGSGSLNDVTGINGFAFLGGSADAGSLVGENLGVEIFGSGNVEGTVGLNIFSPYLAGSGTVGTNYGLYIDDQSNTHGTVPTTNYQFFSNANGGASPFVQLASGNVGIGSSTLFAKLSVQGVGAGTGINFQTTNALQSPLFTILDDGNVGIGTATPQWLLNPSSGTPSQLALSAGAGIAQWAFRNAGGNLYLATTTVSGTATTTVPALTINGAMGAVGIGIANPSFALDVKATSTNVARFSGANSTSCTQLVISQREELYRLRSKR